MLNIFNMVAAYIIIIEYVFDVYARAKNLWDTQQGHRNQVRSSTKTSPKLEKSKLKVPLEPPMAAQEILAHVGVVSAHANNIENIPAFNKLILPLIAIEGGSNP